ncbi:FAD-dependent oxidoreductase [Pyrobaculum calidifontis]|uniref:FAD-dependent pyridine nucleotide-disulfide oxidoreductase n=1 Tax=Pyrobaculum calidifontis (strain DSM 21063 / JCM 11548 / VA1) TaxID=410359 RepID=A3MY56_PYRCJ|nr:FAD-dependent oxidoreductase [Pyrobaculum calidifontis]ABO09573.1 FAD-dependent pyridine nucleotide-disulfide oxidoreductase [Pyrobaculum calidifontis JCM 11548]
MACKSAIQCVPQATREEELNVDVLIVGGSVGGIVAALELKKYGYSPKIVHTGPLGGHRVLVDPSQEIQAIVARANELDVEAGFFDGSYVYTNGVRYKVKYKHLILATGGADVPITFPGSTKVPQKTAEEVLQDPPNGLNVVVWGSSEWGLKTAIALRRRGNNVVVMDNSAYLRDVKYYEEVKSRLDFPIITSARLTGYKSGALKYRVKTVRGKEEEGEMKVDLIVSAVRMVNPYVPMKMGYRVFYSFELNSLVPRRSVYGELLSVDESGRAVGGGNVYAVGHLYGAVKDGHVVDQGRLLAMYIASKDGLEDAGRVKDALDKFLVRLAVEANWLYNLGNRLEKGTDGTGRYVEPNVIDVPHWASYWPQLDELEDVVICPCDGTTLRKVLDEVKRLNSVKELKVKITHEETDLLRHLKVPKVSFGNSVCAESVCIPYAVIILGAALAQRPSYFIYGKPQMLYEIS